MRLLEFVIHGLLSLSIGWFSPRIFTNPKWSVWQTRIYSAVISVIIFVALAVFYLTTGSDVEDKLAELAFCPLISFAHCPEARPIQPIVLPPPEQREQQQAAHSRALEIAVWEAAVRIDTVAGYKEYLRLYPFGAFVGMALARIQELQKPPQAEIGPPPSVRPPSPHIARTPVEPPPSADNDGASSDPTRPEVGANIEHTTDDQTPSSVRCVIFNGKKICG
ncbi:MAG TPA: hypothetical protein VII56_10730 [Rhizomicrobium sp.]